MKNKFYISLSIFFMMLVFSYSHAQNIDSLKTIARSGTSDTAKLSALDALIEFEEDEDIWVLYNDEMKRIAEQDLKNTNLSSDLKKAYISYLADALSNYGFLDQLHGDPQKSIHYFKQSLELREKIGDKQGLGNSLNNLGMIYHNLGQVESAIDCLLRSLKELESIAFKPGIATTLNNLGLVYYKQGDVVSALDYFNKSLKVQSEIHDEEGVATTLNNLGAIYRDKNDFALSLQKFNESLAIRRKIGDQQGIAQCLNNMGMIYKLKNDLSKALEFYTESLNVQEEISDKQGMGYTLNSLCGIMLKQGNTNKAFEYAHRSLLVAKEIGYPENIGNAAELLKEIYQKQNKYKEALAMYELYIQMRDSMNNEETRKAGVKQQLKYEYEKKSAADSVKNGEQQKVKDAQLAAQSASLKQEKTQRYALYGGLVLIAGFLVFVINRFRVTHKQKKIIEDQKVLVDEAYAHLHEKNKEVMDSIYYARRIQRALLTQEIYIEKNLEKLNKNS